MSPWNFDSHIDAFFFLSSFECSMGIGIRRCLHRNGWHPPYSMFGERKLKRKIQLYYRVQKLISRGTMAAIRINASEIPTSRRFRPYSRCLLHSAKSSAAQEQPSLVESVHGSISIFFASIFHVREPSSCSALPEMEKMSEDIISILSETLIPYAIIDKRMRVALMLLGCRYMQ